MTATRRTADHPLWREMVIVTNEAARLLPADSEDDAILGCVVEAQARLVAAIEGLHLPWILADLRRARRALCRLAAGFGIAEACGRISASQSVRARILLRRAVDLVDRETWMTSRELARRARESTGAA